MHNESNSSKSRNGNDLNRLVKIQLENLLEEKQIISYRSEPKYSYPGYSYEQFQPDFEIQTLNDTYIIIDNTTTVRSDRLKQKQWDAHGVKARFLANNKSALYYVLVPSYEDVGNEMTRDRENKLVDHEIQKINNGGYYSQIDGIIRISELFKLILKNV